MIKITKIKIPKIKITKKLLASFAICGGNNSAHLQSNAKWLTNGHWMIRRDKIKITPQAELLFSTTLPSKHVNAMIAESKPIHRIIEYSTTETGAYGIPTSVYSFTDGRKVKFYREYIEMIDRSLLKGTIATSPWFAFDEKGKVWFVLMARHG